VAAIGNGSAFGKGRDLAAWVGLVPREYSTGGKQRLLGISKQGNNYLRRLFVQCARSILRVRERQGAPFGVWLTQLMSRSPQNVVVVALANRLVRTTWAVLFKNEPYRQPDAKVCVITVSLCSKTASFRATATTALRCVRRGRHPVSSQLPI
jgi:transposase